MSTLFFYFFAALILISSIGVVVFKNPIHSALSLVGSLLGVACVYALLNAHFLAAVQVVVYAGAIMVLVLFVLMLLNVKAENDEKRLFIPGALVIILGIFAIYGFLQILPQQALNTFNPKVEIITGDAASIGKLLFRDYLFAFEYASILIMSALVGAVMLAKTKYKR